MWLSSGAWWETDFRAFLGTPVYIQHGALDCSPRPGYRGTHTKPRRHNWCGVSFGRCAHELMTRYGVEHVYDEHSEGHSLAFPAAKAAMRMGVGLQKNALPKSIYPIAAANLWESVYLPLAETENGSISAANMDLLLADRHTAVLIGCGMTACADTRAIVQGFIENSEAPMVLDADALNAIAEEPAVLRKAKAPIVITPHPAEFGRLMHMTPQAVNADREGLAARFAREYGVVTVLKGAGTVIASPEGELVVNPTGNSGMATGGSGDVLAGMTGALLAQGVKPFEAAAAAVYLHGLAGDIAAEKRGRTSMLPSDLIECIPAALRY